MELEVVKEAILKLDDFQLMQPGSSPKENLRIAYGLALHLEDLSKDHKEKPADMFKRAGTLIFDYCEAIEKIWDEFCEEEGLSGGVTGGFRLGDIKYLDIGHAEKFFNISMAWYLAELFKLDLISETNKFVGKVEATTEPRYLGGAPEFDVEEATREVMESFQA